MEMIALVIVCTAATVAVGQPFAYVPVPASACNLPHTSENSLKGEKGDAGVIGKSGPVGPQGQKGRRGENAQQVDLDGIKAKLNRFTDDMTFRDCKDALDRGGRTLSGVYNFFLPFAGTDAAGMTSYCDQDTDGGGWTVIQRRIDGSVNFQRLWQDYVRGFGKVNGEYWLGLDNIYKLGKNRSLELRVDIKDFENNVAYAKYSLFSISSTDDDYRLSVDGYSGNAGDSLASTHSGMKFSTSDNDNDKHSTANCAASYRGGWWYNRCHSSNLNGHYYTDGRTNSVGLSWYAWKSAHVSNKETVMMVRPRQ